MKALIQSSTLLCSLLIATISLAQDSETRNLASFDGISVSAGIEATLVRGSSNKIEISADGIDVDKVTTEIKKDVLRVGIDQNWWNNLTKKNKREVDVTITYSSTLDYISASSGSSVESSQTVTCNDVHLKSSSGARLMLDIEASDVEIDVSSGANMKLAGSAGNVEIDISSGSTLSAYDLEAKIVDVDGSSGSSAKINVSGSLSADVSSGASVRYKGSPNIKDIDKSSGGSVRPN